MRSTLTLGLSVFLAAAVGLSGTYYALEVRGGSRVYSTDQPVRKGRVYLFHRYPDGVYMSLSASEVTGVTSLAEAPQPEGLAPGQARFVGPPIQGGFAPAPAPIPAAPAADAYYPDSGYGYSDWYWGGGGYYPPRPPSNVPPSRIGPNGFPILAPPGSPGSTPPPIGPNGFPILAPAPAAPSPRQR